MELQGKVALVTGASGFVGTSATRRLLQEGVHVRALVRRSEAAEAVSALGAEPVYGDMIDPQAMKEAAAGTQLVVHGALTLSADLEESRRINVGGTEAVLKAAQAAGCQRFVHISTIAVYDCASHDTITEDTPLVTGGDAYSVTKVEEERAVLASAAEGLPAVILRPPFIVGYHPRSFWGALNPRAIAAGEFAIVGSGEHQYPYVHVENLADAIVLALRSEAAAGKAFNIVDGHTTWRRYVEHFRKEPLPSVPADQTWSFMSISGQMSGARARDVLGYAPRRTFEEAMQASLQALQQ